MEFNVLPGQPGAYGIRAGQGPRHLLGGMVASAYATGAETGNSFGLTMVTGGAGAGLPMLRHTASHAGLYVLDGMIDVVIDNQRYQLVRGDYASIPAGTSWALTMGRLRNVAMLFQTGGEASGLFAALGRPYAGFVQPETAPGGPGDLTPGNVDGCDTEVLGPVPEDLALSAARSDLPAGTEAFVIQAGAGDHVIVGEQLFTYTSRNRNTDGRFFTLLTEGPEGPMIPPHMHREHDEMFFCVDGSVRMKAGDDLVELAPGDFLFVPRGTPHAYQFLRPYTRLMGWLKPGIFEPFFEILGDATDVTVYPQEPLPFRFDRVLARLADLDIVPLGGPPGGPGGPGASQDNSAT